LGVSDIPVPLVAFLRGKAALKEKNSRRGGSYHFEAYFTFSNPVRDSYLPGNQVVKRPVVFRGKIALF
jgi:hypothetical protein